MAEMKRLTKGLHRIAATSLAEIGEMIDDGSISRGSAILPPAAVAVMTGDVKTLSQALEAGAIDPSKGPDVSLLHHAAKTGQLGCAALLVKHGADLEAPTREPDGQRAMAGTALMVAIENGHAAVAKLLLEARANTEATDPALNTAVHLAVHNNDTDMLQTLKRHGANLSHQNTNGRSPLHQAVRMDVPAAFHWLLAMPRKLVNLNLSDNWEQTPLHVAVVEGNKTAAHILIEYGGVCAQKCTACRLQTKLVGRAVKKSAEKREQREAEEAQMAAITPADIARAAELGRRLLQQEAEMLAREAARAAQKEQSKGQKKKAAQQRKQLAQIRANLAKLTETEAAMRGGCSGGGETTLEARFSGVGLEGGLLATLEAEDEGDGAGEDEGLSQAEIDAWFDKMSLKIALM
uniref:Uncharacterized protein n=1 Tax=Alexandrium monilatum TaxID=311494 RepID=A0A6T1M1S7_9DINO